MSKTVHEQTEELYTNIVMLRASGYNDEDHKTKLCITLALQERDRIAREEEKARYEMRIKAGYHLTKYINDPELVQKGMVATFCCCHDAFVIDTDELLAEVKDNLADPDEEVHYMVVRIEDVYLICGDFDTTIEQVNCKRVRGLQALNPTK